MPQIKLPSLDSIKLPDEQPETTAAQPVQTSGIKLPDPTAIKLPESPAAAPATEAPEASWYNVITKSLGNMPTRAQRAWEGIKQGVSVAAQNTAQGVTAMQAQSIAQAAAQGVESATAQMSQLGYTPDQVLPADGDSYETKFQKNQNLYSMIDKMKVANLQNDQGFVEARDKALKLSGEIAANTPHTDDWSAKGIVSAITGATADMAGPIGLAMLTKSPTAGLAAMTGQAYGQYYQDSIDKGLDPVKAQSRATVFAALEPLTEAVPLGLILKKGATGLTDLGKSAIAEGLQEGTTQAIQNGYDMGVLNEKMSVGDFLKDVAFNAVVGAGAGGAIHTAVHAPELLRGKEVTPIDLPETAPTAVPEGEYDAMAAEAGTVPEAPAERPQVSPEQYAAYQAQREQGAAPRDALDAMKQQVQSNLGTDGDALSALAEDATRPRGPENLDSAGMMGMEVPAYLRAGDTQVSDALAGMQPSRTVADMVQQQEARGDVGPTPSEALALPSPGQTSVIALPGQTVPPVDMSNRTVINSPVDERAPAGIKLPPVESIKLPETENAAPTLPLPDAPVPAKRSMRSRKPSDLALPETGIVAESPRLELPSESDLVLPTDGQTKADGALALPTDQVSVEPVAEPVKPMATRKPKQNNEVFDEGDTFSVPKKLGTLDPDTNYTVEQKLGTSLVLRSEGGVPAVITEGELQKAFVTKNPKESAPVSMQERGAQKEDTGSNSEPSTAVDNTAVVNSLRGEADAIRKGKKSLAFHRDNMAAMQGQVEDGAPLAPVSATSREAFASELDRRADELEGKATKPKTMRARKPRPEFPAFVPMEKSVQEGDKPVQDTLKELQARDKERGILEEPTITAENLPDGFTALDTSDPLHGATYTSAFGQKHTVVGRRGDAESGSYITDGNRMVGRDKITPVTQPAAESDAFVPRAQSLVDQAKISAAMRKPIANQNGQTAVEVVANGFDPDSPNYWSVVQTAEGKYGIKTNVPGTKQTTKAVFDLYNQVKELRNPKPKSIPSQKRTPSAQSSKKSLTPEQTIAAYKSFTKGMLGTENLQFTVYGKQSDLSEALGLPDGDGRTYMAFYNPGGVEVIAVSENIHSEEDAHAQFRHEIIAHYGLRARLSKPEYDAAMDKVLAAEGVDARLDPYFKEVRDNYGDVYDLTTPDGQRMIAEEVVAAVAENPAQAQKIGVIRNVIEAIKKMLRDIGLLPARATYQDVVDLIQANTDYLRGNRVSNDDVRRSIAPMRFEPPQDMAPSMRRDRRVEEAVAPADIKADMGDTLHAEEGSITETINGIMDNNARKEAARHLYQSTIDDLAPIAYYEKLKTTDGELRLGSESAAKMASMSRQINSIIASAFNVGVPMWDAKMGIVTKPNSKGLLQIFEPIAKMKGNQLALWEHWAGAVRANRLLKEGRENLYTQEMVDRVVNYVNSKPELRKAFNEAHKEYQVFKKDLLDFAEKAGTIDPVARKVWDKDDYVPLYRVADELDRATAPGGAGRSFVNQSSGIKTLKGGTGKVDIINNILRNASHMISSSYNNRVGQMVADLTVGVAMEEVPAQFKPVSIKNEQLHRAMNDLGISVNGMSPQMAEEYSKMFTTSPPVGKDIVSVMYDGKRKYYRVTDPQLMRAINKVGPQAVGSIIKTMGWLGDALTAPKKLLTRTVTSTPGFVVRNITRDILGNYVQQTKAAGRQGVGRILADSLTLRPITKALKGAMDTARDSANVQAYRAAGGFSGGYDGARPDAMAKHLRAMTKENVLKAAPRKLIHAYDKMLEAGELGTRMAVYDDVLKRTGDATEAAYQANDVMNFSRRGDNALLGFFLDVVPFMNARIQGFDRLVRGAVESPASFMLKGAMLSAATLALMAMNADDERYWALPETTRDNYWVFPIAGGFVQIPKPFEVGSLFGTVLERGFEAATRDDKVFWQAMGNMFLNTFAMNPTPQAISPIVQDYMNKDFFQGRPIVSEGMKYKDAADQSDAYTPKVLSDLGKALPESFPDFLRSPVRLQHLLEGYTGSVGQFVLASSDAMYQSALSDAERPARSDMDIPVANLFVKPDNKSSKYVSRVYEMQQETRKATAKLKQYQETRDYDGIRQTREEMGDTLKASKAVEKAAKQLSTISKKVKEVMADPDMTAEAKRAEMDKLTKQKNDIAKQVNDKYWSAVHK